MLEGAFTGKEAGPQDHVYELIQDRADTEEEPLPHGVSAPSLKGQGEEVCLEPQVTHDMLLETCSKMRRGVEVEPLWTWDVTVQNTVRAVYWIRLT